MEDREFNLCSEPWILVMKEDYTTAMVSLTDVIINANVYRGLAGETPTQNIAMLRFLLAVLHTIFSRQDESGNVSPIDSKEEARRRWKVLWDARTFPLKPVRDYLARWEDRFWLFDNEHPFYQVPGIQGTDNPIKKMNGALVESSNKTQLFALKSGAGKDAMSYDESARWLIYLQSYDDCAAKKPSPKLCHTGSLGAVAAREDTLFETLMMNLTLLKDGMELWGDAKPAWERESPVSEKLVQIPVPDNQPELLTMQCRRVLLHRENDYVTGYTEAAGEYIEKESAFAEQMTFWRTSVAEKGVESCNPKTHDKSRQMWRDFSVLIGMDEKSHAPGVVTWIKMLQNKKMIPKGHFVGFEIFGIEYGNMCCGVADEFSDSLWVHASLLDELGKVWQKHIVDEIERCEKMAEAVGNLGADLDKAAGGDGVSARKTAREQAYYRIDIPFRQWLAQVDPEQDASQQREYRMNWRETSLQIIKRLGNELADQAGNAAMTGRNVAEKNNKTDALRHYSAPEAFNRFLRQLKEIDKK